MMLYEICAREAPKIRERFIEASKYVVGGAAYRALTLSVLTNLPDYVDAQLQYGSQYLNAVEGIVFGGLLLAAKPLRNFKVPMTKMRVNLKPTSIFYAAAGYIAYQPMVESLAKFI